MDNKCKIMPLSKETLSDAILLIENIFLYKPDQRNAKFSLKKSLSEDKSDSEYWVCKNSDGKVIGIIGLYSDRRDKAVLWIGWFGVHPKYRHKGIGSRLLKHAEKEAKTREAGILKVYFSFHKNELASHPLYVNHGYVRTRINKIADRIYFSKKIK